MNNLHLSPKKSSFVLSTTVLAVIILLFLFTGCASIHAGRSTVTVEGTGTVKAAPDTAGLSITINETSKTTREAQSLVNSKVNRVLAILSDSGVEDKNLRTASITFRPEYTWKDGVQELVGQMASQTIVFRLEKITEKPEQLSLLLDSLTSVDGIIMNQMSFDIEDKTGLYSDSRELAFDKALAKAEEYADFAEMEVDGVVSISETSSPGFPLPMANRMVMEASPAGTGTATSLPTGEIEITTRITVIFRLK